MSTGSAIERNLRDQLEKAKRAWSREIERGNRLRVRVDELEALINSPRVNEFLESVRTEAAHQVERWGTDHDEGKADADWFWLIGYLAGKAIRPGQEPEKALHHIITTAAACLNWHAHKTGARTRMRPGIQEPKDG